nr:hypothetical protein [Tanacetum cinerariifolium]
LVEPKKEIMMADSSQPREGTVENLLLCARNRKNDTVTFQCKVVTKDIKERVGGTIPLVVERNGGVGESLIEKKTTHVRMCTIVLTSMTDKTYNKSSSLDLKQWKYIKVVSKCHQQQQPQAYTCIVYAVGESLVEPKKEMMMADSSQPREGTVENLLLWARNHKNDTGTFQCKVVIKDIKERVGGTIPLVVERNMLDEYSSIAKAFRMARDWCNTHNIIDFHLRLHSDRKLTRQYNVLTVSEVATIIINDFGDGLPTRDIVINNKDEGAKRISELHPSYMALKYPLLFSYGEDGFHEEIPYHNNTVKENGVTRPKKYSELSATEAIQADCDVKAINIIVQGLPPEVYALVTPTKPGRMTKPYSSHRFIANCFNARNLKIDVKRGLPHAHILLWLEEHSKCKTPSEIDDIISTELPSLTDDLVGYKVVTEYMLWSMWKRRKYAAYTNDGKCSKHFPKPFLSKTFLDEEGYPHYRRRDNKVTIKKGKFTYDDKPVVPHNRYLLLKYNAHINVEWCNRSKSIKYLFKYLNKGPDRETIEIQENVKNGNTLTTEHVLEVDEIKTISTAFFSSM